MSKIAMGCALLAARLTGRRFPFMVNWAITGKCNLRCRHCYGGYGAIQSEELPKDIVFKTIDDLKAMGTKRITLEGGEPLVRRDIVEIAEYIRGKGIEIAMCTNGLLLAEYLDALRQSVDLFVLSLDGREEYNDWLRGKGNYRKVLAALKLLQARRIKPLIFACLVDDDLDDVDALVAIARDHDAYITFSIGVARIGEGDQRVELNKREDDSYRHAIRCIMDHKRQGAPLYYSMKNYRQALHWPTFAIESYRPEQLCRVAAEAGRYMIPCSAGRYWCYIECNGDVYPCYQLVKTIEVKNVQRDGVRDAFSHLSSLSYCCRCYNLTLAELNLQAKLDPAAISRVVANYLFRRS